MDPSEFFAALHAAGLPPVPDAFSVVPGYQSIPRRIIEEIDRFIGLFDALSARPQWQRQVTRDAPAIAHEAHAEVCFFSAWDVHLPPAEPERWKLIEFNDNGSGLLFAALINRLFYELGGAHGEEGIHAPPAFPEFVQHLTDTVAAEARAFFGAPPAGLFLILDDRESLAHGKFRREQEMLRDAFAARGWPSALGTPDGLSGDEAGLRFGQEPVAFVVNRSTDFFWEADAFAPLRAAWRAGRVYAAPNPFTYATRSDKGLLAVLSDPRGDVQLGIEARERAMLDAHLPHTLRVSEETLDEVVARKDALVFKPVHGYAGHGLLPSDQVGRSRLRRLLGKGAGYVAQERVPKSVLAAPGPPGGRLWTDLRVWAYRGQRFLISGRASSHPDRLDLRPPGGWLATYVRS